MKLKIRLKTVNDASLFTAKCNEYRDNDVDYLVGRYIIDGKSLMGILSTGLDKVCEVDFHCDNKQICNQFRQDMKLWISEDK